jgi:uncharacterized metal-binding protein
MGIRFCIVHRFFQSSVVCKTKADQMEVFSVFIKVEMGCRHAISVINTKATSFSVEIAA